jgi:hypothetical protein
MAFFLQLLDRKNNSKKKDGTTINNVPRGVGEHHLAWVVMTTNDEGCDILLRGRGN